MKRVFFRFCAAALFCTLSAAGLSAQDRPESPAPPENAAPESPPGETETPALTREQQVLDMDIRTSSLIELAAWCRSLELSEGGSREDMILRLRGHYGITPPAPADGGGRRVIIESARTTEYFTLDEVDEEYARLRGNVIVRLSDDKAEHRIEAQEVLYNRTRNMISASGSVFYTKVEGDTTETFRGESITVNLDNWSGVFSDSVSERSLSGNETAYRFAGTLISRSGEETTVMTGAVITNAGTDEPFWSISASKLWLLPGSDFAITNILLKVGEIPVLWLPAFFWPSDEVVFHPVIGTRTREGSFVQTTTYILGHAAADSTTESSITRILGSSSGMEQRREGIFLRSTGVRRQEAQEMRLSVMLDAYTNLGIFTGVNLLLPAKAPFGNTEIFAGFGFSRNIYNISGLDTPFPNLDGESEWHTSRIFSAEVPFRYRFKITGSLSGRFGSLSWNFPWYSDPAADRDFMNRSESMDYMKMLQQGSAADTETETASLPSYSWQLSGSFNPRLEFLAPAVQEFSFTSISSSMQFGKRRTDPAPFSAVNSSLPLPDASPDYEFFYPSQFTIISAAMRLSGTPVSFGQTNVSGGMGGNGGVPEAFAGIPSPFEAPAESAPSGPAAPGGASPDPARAYAPEPPAISSRFDLPRTGLTAFTWNYQLNPSFSSTMDFGRSDWKTLEDVAWEEIISVMGSLRSDASTGITLSDSVNGVYSVSLRLLGNVSWQDYFFMDENASRYSAVATRNSLWDRAYGNRSFTTSGETTLTLKPFYQSAVWGNTSFQYTLRGLIAKSVYQTVPISATQPLGDPVYSIVWGDWTRDRIETHQASASFSASIMDQPQTLTFLVDMPPRATAFTGTAALKAWIFEATASQKVTEPFDGGIRVFDPLSASGTVRFAPRYYFQETMRYNWEKDGFESLASYLVLGDFSASYSMSLGPVYELVDNGMGVNPRYNWAQKPEAFSPRDLRAAWSHTFQQQNLFGNLFSFTVYISTSLTLDLQRYTNSRFVFDMRITLKITDFLDFSLSASSANDRIFRYFQDLPFFSLPDGFRLPGETNIFIDLLNSFRFDDDVLRTSSGFKLKSLALNATHYMGDWKAVLSVTLTPALRNNAFYEFIPVISFLVQWTPIPEIKADTYLDNQGQWGTR